MNFWLTSAQTSGGFFEAFFGNRFFIRVHFVAIKLRKQASGFSQLNFPNSSKPVDILFEFIIWTVYHKVCCDSSLEVGYFKDDDIRHLAREFNIDD